VPPKKKKKRKKERKEFTPNKHSSHHFHQEMKLSFTNSREIRNMEGKEEEKKI
jgi:hypothetical protein